VSLLLRAARNPEVVERHAQAEAEGAELVLCPVVAYEIRRGLEHRSAARQQEDFAVIERHWERDDLVRQDWALAAKLWARRASEGRPTSDADLLIAAHAARLGATIVTSNVRHFEGLGVAVEDWKGGGASP
jgi:predicted nucleic acid-binding protein